MKKIIFTLLLIGSLCQIKAQTLIEATFIETLSEFDVSQQYGLPIFFVRNGVNLYKVTYNTPDIDGNNSIASGLVAIPDDPAIYPLLSYQHGTVGSREDVPSNLAGDPIGIIFSALGYVSASADYLGLGDSPGPHPYVHAATQASAGIDLLFATRELLQQEDQPSQLNDQLFVAGYSQGGHAAAALHREIQENYTDEFTVTASAPMSGPYSISGAMRDLILDDSEYFSTAYIPNTMLSYNAVYDIYDTTEDFFKPEYAVKIDQFAAEEITLWELEAELQALLQANEGGSFPKRMLQDTLAAAVETNPDHPINVALADNDVFDWAPQAPTRLYYCMADDQVPFQNSIIADDAMNAAGAPDTDALDLNSNFDHGQCVTPAITEAITFFSGFQNIEELPTSTADLLLPLTSVTISPNPATDFILIDWQSENTEVAEVKVYNSKGRFVQQFNLESNEAKRISLTGIPAGLYWVNVRAKNRATTLQAVIMK